MLSRAGFRADAATRAGPTRTADREPMTSTWRAEKNAQAFARLRRALPERFPAPVLVHSLARPLTPPTPRLAVDAYWRDHPIRADRLARALAARSGAPSSWAWRLGADAVRRDPAARPRPGNLAASGGGCTSTALAEAP